MTRILPQPTNEKPYAQVEFVFHLIANTKANTHTKANYISALNYYKKFLDNTHNYNENLASTRLFFLDKHWDEFALYNLKKYMESNRSQGNLGGLSSYSHVGILSAVRMVIKEATLLGYTSFENVFDVSIGGAERETETNVSYSLSELEQIKNVVKEELKYTYRVYRRDGYRFTGVGNDPRIKNHSWGKIDNMRWYFENVLNLKPILGTAENIKIHNSYVMGAPTRHYKSIQGLRGIYRKWGVAPLIDSEIIMPLVLQLTMVTGLNVQSVLELDIDCFEEKNPLTGAPVLKYFKGRSKGEKELHININHEDENVGLREFRQKQVKQIQNTIKMIQTLTEPIRSTASLSLQNKLFIVQSSSTTKFGEVIKLSKKISSHWCRKMVFKYNLQKENGETLQFNLRRFRSTNATYLIFEGADLHELQYELGHKNIETTMKYIDKNKLNVKANEDTTNVIEKIFSNLAWANENEVKYSTSPGSMQENEIFKGFLCDCKNPFNPPDDVKKLKDYQEGEGCSRVNMCMFCENVLIFKRNLPSLWMYKCQIEAAMAAQSTELPNENYYRKTLNIINALFDIKTSEFSREDILEAQILAENLDELVDPITYRAEMES